MAAEPIPRQSRIPFQTALEGLRGFLVPGVLCFHAEFSWARGGFLPLPTFFTLSGYLITSLLLAERERSGRIRLGRFWDRRLRRLMPAALLTLAAMSLFARYVATPDQLPRLRGDVIWSLFYLANWHFVQTHIAYADLFSAPSPLQHFWSLAVEEQFYFLYPFVLLAALRVGRGSRALLGAVLGALVAASIAASLALTLSGSSVDRVYYGSDTRAAELLLGGLLAVFLHGREIADPRVRRLLDALGAISLVAMVGLWTQVSLRDRWLYVGGFAAYSVLSMAVIAAAVQPSGLVQSLLSVRGLRWLGRISYATYLFHWPVFLWLSPERTGLAVGPLFLLRVAVTLALAEVSYRWVESPVRSGRVLRKWHPVAALPAAFAAVPLLFMLSAPDAAETPAGAASEEAAVHAYAERLRDRIADGSLAAADPPSSTRETPRVSVFGDSTAVRVAAGLLHYLEQEGAATPGIGVVELGCGLLRQGTFRWKDLELPRPPHCLDRDRAWSDAIARGRPDIAIVAVGPWEVCDRKLRPDDRWRHLGDPVLDDELRREMLAAIDLLAKDGTLVIWVTSPEVHDPVSVKPYPETDSARMIRFNELVLELEKLRPGAVRVADLAAHVRTLPKGVLDRDYRPDGVHLSNAGALRLAREWLAGEVLRLYRDQPRRS